MGICNNDSPIDQYIYIGWCKWCPPTVEKSEFHHPRGEQYVTYKWCHQPKDDKPQVSCNSSNSGLVEDWPSGVEDWPSGTSIGNSYINTSGWWLTYPSEKWWNSSVGMMKFPIYIYMESQSKFHGSSHHQSAIIYSWPRTITIDFQTTNQTYMGLSENSVPLHPMVNDHYPYLMAIMGNIPHFQTNPYFMDKSMVSGADFPKPIHQAIRVLLDTAFCSTEACGNGKRNVQIKHIPLVYTTSILV